MKWYRVRAICRKEFIHVFRDPRSLAMAVAIPMLLLLLFGYALSLDVDRVPLVVWDQSDSPESRELVSRFVGSRYFTFRGAVRNYAEMERAIDTARALVALVVPSDFARQVRMGTDSSVQFIADGSDANTASMAISYARATTAAYSQAVILDAVRRAGKKAPEMPLEVRPRVWFNEDMESRNYIVPGLIAVIMMVITALLTSLTVAREWERGTMEQLISTPVKGPELILGKFIPYFAIGMTDVLISVLMGEFLFHVPLRGSVILLFVMAAVFLTGALSMGILISVIAKNQFLANEIALVATFLPSFLLSGFIYPISNMPLVLQVLTHIVPARYFVALMKGIYLKGVGLDILWREALLLVVFVCLVVFLAIMRFKKKVI
jgi:ABC-2 type transport system permease protein